MLDPRGPCFPEGRPLWGSPARPEVFSQLKLVQESPSEALGSWTSGLGGEGDLTWEKARHWVDQVLRCPGNAAVLLVTFVSSRSMPGFAGGGWGRVWLSQEPSCGAASRLQGPCDPCPLLGPVTHAFSHPREPCPASCPDLLRLQADPRCWPWDTSSVCPGPWG